LNCRKIRLFVGGFEVAQPGSRSIGAVTYPRISGAVMNITRSHLHLVTVTSLFFLVAACTIQSDSKDGGGSRSDSVASDDDSSGAGAAQPAAEAALDVTDGFIESYYEYYYFQASIRLTNRTIEKSLPLDPKLFAVRGSDGIDYPVNDYVENGCKASRSVATGASAMCNLMSDQIPKSVAVTAVIYQNGDLQLIGEYDIAIVENQECVEACRVDEPIPGCPDFEQMCVDDCTARGLECVKCLFELSILEVDMVPCSGGKFQFTPSAREYCADTCP
jgi:hypothetical protein